MPSPKLAHPIPFCAQEITRQLLRKALIDRHLENIICGAIEGALFDCTIYEHIKITREAQ